MKKPRGFNIPQYKYHSTTGARAAYFKAFQIDWGGDDNYLRELGREMKKDNPTATCNDFVILMRENS